LEGKFALFWFIILVIGSYLVGSIPFGYLMGRLRGVDLRHHGSGNIGTTNAFRVLGRQLGMLVFFCDAAKGFFPALIGAHHDPAWGVAAGLAAVVGHNWSVFLGFRGGRGAATGMGVALALITKEIFLALIIWLLVVSTTGYVSLGSIIATLSVPVIALIFNVPFIYFIFVISAVIMIVIKHLPNIRRLRNGTENRMRIW
jgi:glycerol-3-phosphate acyltransferase PlsY